MDGHGIISSFFFFFEKNVFANIRISAAGPDRKFYLKDFLQAQRTHW